MSNQIDPMSPEASPGAVSKSFGGRRLNNVPLFIIGTIVTVFIVIIAMVAVGRQEKPADNSKAGPAPKTKGNTTSFAKAVIGDNIAGQIAATSSPPPVPPADPASDKLLVARPSNADTPPTPPLTPPGSNQDLRGRERFSPDAQNEAQTGRFTERRREQFEQAIKARSTAVSLGSLKNQSRTADTSAVGGGGSREADLARIAEVRRRAQAIQTSDPTAAYNARLAAVQGGIGISAAASGSGASGLLPTAASTSRNDVSQFTAAGKADRWKLGNSIEAPNSPYELRAGATVIPGTLISGIDSTLPGQIWGQVSQDICDTATGMHLLIPQGTRTAGMHASEVVYGQANILVGWQRLIFPDGRALDIGSMPGSTGAGYSGFSDQVDNHYVRIFGSAFLMSGITAGVALSQGPTTTTNGQVTAASAMTEALGQQLGQASAQMIAKNLNISPTLKIRPGYRFNIMVTKDLTFQEPYKKFGCTPKGKS